MHRRTLWTLTGLLLAAPVYAVMQDTMPDIAPVDAIFSSYDHPDSPGCALGVIRDGNFAYRRGYGMANLEYDIPITSRSVFRIGSTSKQFTAMAVALLAESGQIALDEPLRKYFPEFPGWADDITVRQLVHHTSGIRDYLTLAFLAGKGDDADFYTDEWVIDLLARQQQTNFPAGSQHLYSNSGYLLLAHLVKRVTGQSLREYSQQHIFEPLGMKYTHFHDDHTEIVPRRASGYAPVDGGYRISMTTLDMVGDGGVFTRIDDLLAWDRNFYNNELGAKTEALTELMTTPGTLADGSETRYAFGLDVSEYRGQQTVSHGGAFVGYRAELLRFPTQHFSVAVLCNRADAAPEMLARKVADIFLDDVLTAPDAATTDTPAALPKLSLDEQALQLYTGDFWEPDEAFAAEVRLIDGKLWAVHSPTRRNELRPVGPNQFRMLGVPARVLVEYSVEEGRVVEMRRTINAQPRGVFTSFTRRQVTTEELSAYTGDFYSNELDTAYRLFEKDGLLWFELDDEGPQELTAMFDEAFENPDYGAFTFQRADDGQVSGFVLQSGRVRNLVFNRR